jgi:hypothetical protein
MGCDEGIGAQELSLRDYATERGYMNRHLTRNRRVDAHDNDFVSNYFYVRSPEGHDDPQS